MRGVGADRHRGGVDLARRRAPARAAAAGRGRRTGASRCRRPAACEHLRREQLVDAADPPDAEALAGEVGERRRCRSRPAIRYGSDLFGDMTAAEVGRALGGRLQQRLERDVGHLALAGAERGHRERGLLHADELDVDAGAVEVALLLGEFHHRVRHQRHLHVGDDHPEGLRAAPAARANAARTAADIRRFSMALSLAAPSCAARHSVPRQRSIRRSASRRPSVIVTPIIARTTTTARYSAIWKRLP